jgi:hypothetical protein
MLYRVRLAQTLLMPGNCAVLENSGPVMMPNDVYQSRFSPR